MFCGEQSCQASTEHTMDNGNCRQGTGYFITTSKAKQKAINNHSTENARCRQRTRDQTM